MLLRFKNRLAAARTKRLQHQAEAYARAARRTRRAGRRARLLHKLADTIERHHSINVVPLQRNWQGAHRLHTWETLQQRRQREASLYATRTGIMHP